MKIIKNIIYTIITIGGFIALCYAGIIITENIGQQSFLKEARSIIDSVKLASKTSEKSYYDNNYNWLRDYNGVYNYVIKLNDNKEITYYLIYSDKYEIESPQNIETTELSDTDIVKIKNAEDITKLDEKRENIVDDLRNNTVKEESGTTQTEETKETNPTSNETVSGNTSSNTITKEEEKLTYTIGEKNYNYDTNKRTCGHTEEMLNGSFIITIYMGKKNTGGYSIDITRVNVNGNDAVITVKETTPNPRDTVTQALTSPAISISFNRKPNSYRIITESGNEYCK